MAFTSTPQTKTCKWGPRLRKMPLGSVPSGQSNSGTAVRAGEGHDGKKPSRAAGPFAWGRRCAYGVTVSVAWLPWGMATIAVGSAPVG